MFGLNSYLLIGVALLLAAAGAAVGVTRWQLSIEKGHRVAAERELSDYQAAAKAVIEERLRAQQAEADRNIRITNQIKAQHATEVAAINARYRAAADRMRADLAAARSAAGVPPAASATDGTDAADPVGRFVEALGRCETGLRQLDALQRWIRETH